MASQWDNFNRSLNTYPSSLNLRDEHKHQLVLVYPRRNPKDDGAGEGDQGCKWRKDERNSTHKELRNS